MSVMDVKETGMEKHIQALFNPTILKEALNRYDLPNQDVQRLDGFESFIFNVHQHGEEKILRIGHDSRRSASDVLGEAAFLNYLADHSLSVPQVFPDLKGNLASTLPAEDHSCFIATLFSKAEGHPPTREAWQPELFEHMGQFLGKLHHLSKSYHPASPRHRRFDIKQDFANMEQTGINHLPPQDAPILEVYRDLVKRIQSLPKNPQSYGLIHIDFHRGNFFITDEGRITLFDFDDCQYAWFIYDIAMALFYAIPHDCQQEEDRDNAEIFLSHFWQGYQKENALDESWLEKIPLFLNLREIDLYMIIHRSFDIHNLDPWCASFMENRREKILKHVPYCDIPYCSIH